MNFNTLEFLLFLPAVLALHWALPHRLRWALLLASSWLFYFWWEPVAGLLLVAVILVTWLCGLGAAREKPPAVRRACLAMALGACLGCLGVFKYAGFFAGLIPGGPAWRLLLPVGISFYTFQAIGYLVDVWRGEVAAERNFLRYALFLSFFPQLVAGPIERSRNLLHQIHEPQRFDFGRAKDGLLLMGWGFFQKLVVADRIAVLVDGVYGDYTSHSGLQILLATVLFAFQIYCDFAGYSDIAIGAARVMGFALTKNFRSPYFATTVSGFWRDWHISLTTWFRDYVYIPLGGNRRGRARKYRNLLLTFGASGLWHGAGWNFVAWGLLNGLYQVAGDMTRTLRQRLGERLHVRTDCGSHRLLQGLVTFGLVDFAWLFFRAESFAAALGMLGHGMRNIGLFGFFSPDNLLGIQTMALSEKDFFVMLLGVAVLMLVDYGKKRGVDFKAALARQNVWFRWMVYYVVIFTVLIFGVYGPAYDASTFIYFQF